MVGEGKSNHYSFFVEYEPAATDSLRRKRKESRRSAGYFSRRQEGINVSNAKLPGKVRIPL